MPDLAFVSLANVANLRTLRVTVHFDPGSEAKAHYTLWTAIERLIRSLPTHAPLTLLVLRGVLTRNLLTDGSASPPIVQALQSPLCNFVTRLAAVINYHGDAAVVIKPPYPAATYTECEQERIEGLLGAFAARNRLRY